MIFNQLLQNPDNQSALDQESDHPDAKERNFDPKWLSFEGRCAEYLNETFGDYANFEHVGMRNSTLPDILVKTNGGQSFYMEAKLPNAHFGQFVVLQDDQGRFFFSDANKSLETESASAIISFMNAHADEYASAGTAGVTLDGISDAKNVFNSWICEKMNSNNVKYIISKNSGDAGDYVIIPAENFPSCFTVSACYRVKPSGSSRLPKKSLNEIQQFLNNRILNDKGTADIVGGRLVVSASGEIGFNKFEYNNKPYYLSPTDGQLTVRKLSMTKNANVIFKVSLNSDVPALAYREQFVRNLQELSLKRDCRRR